jgi:hypothetical protein
MGLLNALWSRHERLSEVDRCGSFGAADQFAEPKTKRGGEGTRDFHTDADLAQLNGTDVGAVDVRSFRELLLGQPEFLPYTANLTSEGETGESG